MLKEVLVLGCLLSLVLAQPVSVTIFYSISIPLLMYADTMTFIVTVTTTKSTATTQSTTTTQLTANQQLIQTILALLAQLRQG
uniref:Uncharacterized protein n=1 Tax=Gasterosteus aculeatus aculeatus TaxID=481459 RepID=A0AAQ4PNN5_GASAC